LLLRPGLVALTAGGARSLRGLHAGQPLDDREDHAGVLLAEPRGQRRLLVVLGRFENVTGT